MRQQRIVLVSSSYHPRIGGVEQHVREVAGALGDLGHPVEVWTVAAPGDPETVELDGVRVRYLPCPLPRQSIDGVVEFARQGPAAARRWWRAWRAMRPDLVHVHCFGPNGPWSLVAGALGRRPVVISSHGETFADREVFDSSWLLRTALRLGVRRARAVTGCSAAVTAALRADHGLRGGEVVRGGVRPVAARSTRPDGLPPGARYVLGAGRLVHVKGFDVLVAAARRLPSDCWVVVAGDGPERAQIAGERVLDIGPVPAETVRSLMADAAVVAVPSRREAFGLVVLEAWSAGTPVVASAVDGLADLVHHGRDGILVAVDNPEALAAGLRAVLQDPERARTLAVAGRRRAEGSTWSATARSYAAIYRRILGDSPANQAMSGVRT